jgi:hypothetical protein
LRRPSQRLIVAFQIRGNQEPPLTPHLTPEGLHPPQASLHTISFPRLNRFDLPQVIEPNFELCPHSESAYNYAKALAEFRAFHDNRYRAKAGDLAKLANAMLMQLDHKKLLAGVESGVINFSVCPLPPQISLDFLIISITA